MVGRHTRLLLALAAAILAVPAPAAAGAAVLYVGDSLGVGTAPYLRDDLGSEALTVDAKIGRPSSVGVDLLGSLIGTEYDVVVFDLGTNDDPAAPAGLAADLAAARRIAGDRCLVVATLNRPPLNGVSVDGLNRAVSAFAASSPNVQLVDWHAAAVHDPGLLVDGIHSGSDGYALRARLLAAAIDACGTFGGSSPSSAPGDLEHETGGGLPPASAGRNTPAGGAGQRSAHPGHGRDHSGPPGLDELATAVGRAVGTGAEFG
jgi:lysophospholipase L1-like esterase